MRLGLFRVTPGESLRRALNLPRATYGMVIAHLGVAVLVAGVVASSAWRVEVILAMEPGQSQEIEGYTVRFDGVAPAQGPNYSAERATFTVFRDGEQIAVMHEGMFVGYGHVDDVLAHPLHPYVEALAATVR